MPASIAVVRLAVLAGLWLLAPACSSGDDDDSNSGVGGTGASGGSSAAGGTAAGGSTSGAGGSGGQSPVVDCRALCDHVATVCAGQSTIDANWLDVCRSACDVRVQVAPDTAVLEKTCVDGAPDCTEAVLCVASPH